MKLTINMLSKADSVEGQGVGSAYIEQVNLIKEELGEFFDVRINSKKKADIVHVHSVNPSFYFRFKRKNGIRVMYCHFLPETLKGSIRLPKLFFKIYCKYVMSFYKKAEYLVVVNPIFIQDLVNLGVEESHIKYIPNYVSNKQFFPLSPSRIHEVRKKYNISLDKFVVLGCGQVQTRKGVTDFVEIAKNNPDIEFVWAGGFSFKAITDGYNELKKIVDNPPCDNLHFIGIIPRTEMNDIFNMTDILWDNYLYGTNNQEFSDEIRKLVSDKAYYQHACELAKNIADYYSKDNVASLWKKFYLSIYEKNQQK